MVNVWCIAYMRSTPCTWYTPSRSVAIHGHLSCVLLQLVEHVEQQLVRAATNGLFDQLFDGGTARAGEHGKEGRKAHSASRGERECRGKEGRNTHISLRRRTLITVISVKGPFPYGHNSV